MPVTVTVCGYRAVTVTGPSAVTVDVTDRAMTP